MSRTRPLWDGYSQHPGNRQQLFEAVAEELGARTALYPGCYVDLSPSFVLDRVTYVDVDRPTRRFFADKGEVDAIIAEHRRDRSPGVWAFLAQDYTTPLAVEPVDLLISLYAGFVSEHCTRYLRPGGLLLANTSHGDVAMASLDPRYRLVAVVTSREGRYTVKREDLEGYLTPKRAEPTRAELHATRRGVAYRRSAFGYVFRRDG